MDAAKLCGVSFLRSIDENGSSFPISFFLINFYLFIFRERGREIGSETSISYLLYTPNWRPDLQPRHVP